MKFFNTIKDIFSIEELRNRIVTTIGYLLIFRLGSFILLPGVDYDVVEQMKSAGGDANGLIDLINMFSGGAFENKSIFGLGIMPYISASIIMQLLQVAVPSVQKMQKDGESGRKKVTQITRVLTIGICLVQAYAFITLITNQENVVVINKSLFIFSSLCILTAGTMFCMWLGEKITEKGIGNGISMLIMIGIISRLPAQFIAEVGSKWDNDSLLFLVLELAALFFIVMFAVMLTQGTRRIPVNYAKQVVGNKVYGGGQRQYIPIKVNTAGVMPIIFAQSLMMAPMFVFEKAGMTTLAQLYQDPTSWAYTITSAVMIVIFTFFYTALVINPQQISDDLKRNGGFIPGIKPGEATANFIDDILSKVTLPGAVFIAAIAIMPAVASTALVDGGFAQFFGGTSLLILVGVVLDTLQQIESYLLLRKYDGMMKSGKLKGRNQEIAVV